LCAVIGSLKGPARVPDAAEQLTWRDANAERMA